MTTLEDQIALENDDKVLLRFTPSSTIPNLLSIVENDGEFIRDTATVTIIDCNCKLHYLQLLYPLYCGHISFLQHWK